MITDRSLRVLEFVKIREQLAALALTPSGAEMCRGLVPYGAFDLAENAQRETEEAVIILSFIGGHPMAGFSDVREYLELCEKGATLAPRALLEIAVLLRAIAAAKKALVTDRDNTPLITQKASFLGFFGHLNDDIANAILSEDEIADRASADLYDIRRNMRKTSDKVREKLNSMIRSATFQKYLQDPIVTMRSDRYVLPVKQEYRTQVPGLVHDQSSSGATLFIEPMAVVELNNELKQWEAKEKLEIERILQALSAQIAPYAEQLKDNFLLLTELDFAFAKGLLARDMKAVQPKMNEKGIIRLKRARHPLIDPKKVVPSDLWLGQDFTTLIITGPNTGGKTVTLKTVGLLTLMAQAGLQVPADIGTELSFFENVYADIGDEQSIEQSLSTFSSHMTNIVEIINNVTGRDLALFDELGAGTDPTEGAALAQSILSALLEKKVRVLATTHYSELKAFALSTVGIENASVEFNVETLRPTYRLSIGVPGKSNAFEISRKLGLPEDIIDKSKELLSNETIRFEDVIANAEYHRQIAEKERLLAEEAHFETQRLKDAAERLRREMEDKRENALKKAREDAKRVMENARRESEEIIAELKKMKKEGAVTQDHKAAELRHRMEIGLDALSEGLTQKNPSLVAPPKDLNPGDLVDIVHLNQRGTVLAKPDPKGEVQLQAGILKLKAHISQLRLVNEEAPKKKSVAKTATGALTRTVPMSFDVRGMALDEALPEVDRYLDEAVMGGLNEVTIVHGKGTGILRAGIQQHLKRHGHVKSHRLGIYGEGETGVTIVTLK